MILSVARGPILGMSAPVRKLPGNPARDPTQRSREVQESESANVLWRWGRSGPRVLSANPDAKRQE
jgi:hypothetical protein